MPQQKKAAAAPQVTGPILDVNRNVLALVTTLANKITSSASSLFREHFGIGTMEWRVITLLAAEPWVNSKRIAEVIAVDKAAVSRSMKTLDEKGLILLQERETRSPRFALSQKGVRLHDRVMLVSLERERRLLSVLSQGERDALIEVLNRLHGAIEIMNGPIET